MLLQTLFIYISFIAVLYYCGTSIEKKSRVMALSKVPLISRDYTWTYIIMFLFFAIMVGLRYDVGTDHLTYWNAYERGTLERFEYLFLYLSSACRAIGFHPTIYFGILGFIQIAFFYLAFKDEKYLYPFFAVFLFTDGLFGSWMNTIRQDIACCIWIYALNYITKKNLSKYILFCALAFLFHRSAIVLIILYPIFKGGKDYFHNIPIQLVVLLTAFLLKDEFGSIITLMDRLFSVYSNIIFLGKGTETSMSYSVEGALDAIGQNVSDVRQSGIGVIVKSISYLCVVVFSNKIKSFFKGSKVNLIYTLFFISFVFYIILPEGVWSLARPVQYLTCTRMIMLSYMVCYFFKYSKGVNRSLGLIVLLLHLLLLFVSNIISSQSHLYHGYQLFFQV